MITVIRIDDRLVHGQVIEGWVRVLNLDKIILIDDQVAGDYFQRKIMKMALPPGLEILFVTVAEALMQWASWSSSPDQSIVLVSNPRVILTLLEQGILLKALNVGCMHFEQGKEMILKSVYLSREEKEIFKKISAYGVAIEGQGIPAEKSTSMNALLEGAEHE